MLTQSVTVLEVCEKMMKRNDEMLVTNCCSRSNFEDQLGYRFTDNTIFDSLYVNRSSAFNSISSNSILDEM